MASLPKVVKTRVASPRVKKVKPVIAGKRVGKKRSDFRWLDTDGNVWASRFEYSVYTALKEQGVTVRKTTTEDSIPYTSVVPNSRCRGCESVDVVQDRVFTPDLFIVPQADDGQGKARDSTPYYIEAKGFLRADRRSLLRRFRQAEPGARIRFIIERDYRVSAKRSLSQWITDFLKYPVIVWKGSIPNDWR